MAAWTAPPRLHHDLLVGGGTANDVASIERLLSLGADFVDSDRPALAVAASRARADGEERVA